MFLRRLILAWALAAPLGLLAQDARGPLARQKLEGSPVVTLDTPTTDFEAYGAALGSVLRAGVRYGIEGPALDPSVPQFDFARPPSPNRTLTGLELGEALDIVTRANPRMRWSEADGMVLVRLTNRDSFLDRRIRRYAVDNAAPRVALEALIRELAPNRVTAGGVDGVAGTSPDVDARMEPRKGRNVTVALENPTVLEVLNRISRENGALSWNVRYDRAPADISTAIVTLNESGRVAVAGPPRPSPSPTPRPGSPTGPPTADLHRLSINSEMPLALTSYARAVEVPIGMERLAYLPESGVGRPSTIIDVAGIRPATAISWIVAYDSRFEWRERSGRFLIRPKADAGKPSALDKPLGSFVRDKKPFEAVVADWLREIGADALPPRMDVTRTVLAAGTLESARRAEISVSLRRATTARDALDAICESAGKLSWDLREQFSTNTSARTFSLEITSPVGWRYMVPFRLSGAALPAVPAVRAPIPPEMDRDIARPSSASNAGPVSAFLSVAAAARLPIGIDAGTIPVASRDPRLTQFRSAPTPAPLEPGRLSEILATVLSRSPEFELTVREGVINLAPRGSVTQPDHFLNQTIGPFTVMNVPTWKAVSLARLRMNPATRTATLADVPGGTPKVFFSTFDRPVSLDLPNSTARDVLNAIVFANGGVGWTMRYAGAGGAPGRAIEADGVLELWPMTGSAYMSVQVSRAGLWAETPGDARVSMTSSGLPQPPDGMPRALLSLPIESRRLTVELSRWCRTLSMKCTVEFVGPPLVGGPMGPPTAQYDFTGMAAKEALEKLTTFVPDVEWREEAGVYRIRSRALPSTGMALDRVVASVDHTTGTLNEVFTLIRSIVSGDKPLLPGLTAGPTVMSSSQDQRNRPVTLKMSNVTVRQILDEVARQYGDCSWSVRYTEANGTYPEMLLTIMVATGSTGVTLGIK